MAVQEINKDTFQKEVLDNKGMVFVDFHAEWCGPCKVTGPIIEELSNEMKDIKFVKIDVDANQELAAQFNIFSIPNFIIFKEGKPASQFVGAMAKEGFIEQINNAKH